jgi:protein-S-isoprenylcysteine O-methyltransferase Ste14
VHHEVTNLRREHNREEWMREVELSQRNTVFPDATRNEADFWRRLLRQRKLTSIQTVGLLILAATVFAVCFPVAKDMLSYRTKTVVFIVLSTLAFCVLQWRVRKALREEHSKK